MHARCLLFHRQKYSPWRDDVFARAGDSIAVGSAYLLPVRPPPKDSGTRVTPFTRPSAPKVTTRISGANPSGLKRHSQVSLSFISYTSPGRPSRFRVSSRVVFPGMRRWMLSSVKTCRADLWGEQAAGPTISFSGGALCRERARYELSGFWFHGQTCGLHSELL